MDYDFVQSENQKSVERLVKMFINNGYKTIVIVGGDSALNDAVNCLMQVDAERSEEVALGVIPNGLMNDFAHFWGFDDSDIEKTMASGSSSVVSERLTSVVSDMPNKKGENCRRYFLNCINIGLIAAIMNLRRRPIMSSVPRTCRFLFSFILMIFQRSGL